MPDAQPYCGNCGDHHATDVSCSANASQRVDPGMLADAIVRIGIAADAISDDLDHLGDVEALGLVHAIITEAERHARIAERVSAYASQCAVLRQEPTTEGLRRALDVPPLPTSEEVDAILAKGHEGGSNYALSSQDAALVKRALRLIRLRER